MIPLRRVPVLAATLLSLAAPPLSAQSLPWKAGDAAPVVAGIRLGDTRARLDSVLGPPAGRQELGPSAQAFSYRGGAIVVSWTELDGAAVIDLRTREAGEIGGIRVGDTVHDLLAKWGMPNGGEGTTGLYIVGAWVIVVRSDDRGEDIVMLSIGRVADP